MFEVVFLQDTTLQKKMCQKLLEKRKELATLSHYAAFVSKKRISNSCRNLTPVKVAKITLKPKDEVKVTETDLSLKNCITEQFKRLCTEASFEP